MLHYNFPPFSTGEAKRLRGVGRRELGHGNLAKRALVRGWSPRRTFPYVLRVVGETLESNGSSSMATVCAGSLALMDAGVPLRKPVAGIAMGLVMEGERYAVLSDILGSEDALGDMDFKVCGTRDGVTALQMDIKITGVTPAIMHEALAQARDAGGKIIKEMSAEFDAKIDVDDDGTVKIFCSNEASAKALKEKIEGIAAVPEVGRIYEGVVRTIKDFGAFVQILPGTDGMVHISELAPKRVEKVTDILKEGDTVRVKVIEIDSRGRIRLSRKAALDE
jgi:polyribonucleotide nucleotidyltransferase